MAVIASAGLLFEFENSRLPIFLVTISIFFTFAKYQNHTRTQFRFSIKLDIGGQYGHDAKEMYRILKNTGKCLLVDIVCPVFNTVREKITRKIESNLSKRTGKIIGRQSVWNIRYTADFNWQ